MCLAHGGTDCCLRSGSLFPKGPEMLSPMHLLDPLDARAERKTETSRQGTVFDQLQVRVRAEYQVWTLYGLPTS